MNKPAFRLSVIVTFFMYVVCTSFIGCGDEGNPLSGGGTTELEGTWVGTADDALEEDWKFIIKGNTIEAYAGGINAYKGTFTLTTTADPKQFTCKITSSVYAEYVGKQSLAIYRLNGTSLTFAGNEPGNPNRPASFTSTDETMLLHLSKW